VPSNDELVVSEHELDDEPEDLVLWGGASSADQPVTWETHSHRSNEILFPRSGIVVVRSGAQMWTLLPGRGLWIPALLRHSVRVAAGAQFLTVYCAVGQGPSLGDHPVAVHGTPLLYELFLHLSAREMSDDARGRAERVFFDLVVPSDARGAIKIPDAGPVGRIARDLLARPEDPRSFEDWANEIGVSTSTLARRFKVDTGVSFGQWRVLLRMNVAMSLLGQGAAVADVAERIGYSTPSSFVAAFKQSTGVTPMVFRKNADH